MLYMFLGSLLTDILSVIGWGLAKLSVDLDFVVLRQIVMIITICTTLFLIIYGLINARHPRIKRLDLVIDKQMKQSGRFRIAMASDLHLGTIVARGMAERITTMIE